MGATTMVHVRAEERTKAKAAKALAAMGLSASDAVRLLLARVAAEQAIPFDVKVPNAKTVAAMRELEGKSRGGRRFKDVAGLMADLNEGD